MIELITVRFWTIFESSVFMERSSTSAMEKNMARARTIPSRSPVKTDGFGYTTSAASMAAAVKITIPDETSSTRFLVSFPNSQILLFSKAFHHPHVSLRGSSASACAPADAALPSAPCVPPDPLFSLPVHSS